VKSGVNYHKRLRKYGMIHQMCADQTNFLEISAKFLLGIVLQTIINPEGEKETFLFQARSKLGM
jgi:hypothetical protein